MEEFTGKQSKTTPFLIKQKTNTQRDRERERDRDRDKEDKDDLMD